MGVHEFKIRKGPFAGKTVKMSFQEPGRGDSLVQAIINVAYEILDEIVAPICEIPGGIGADIYLACLWDYGDDKQMRLILDKVAARYGVDRDRLESLDRQPVGLIAMYVLEARTR